MTIHNEENSNAQLANVRRPSSITFWLLTLLATAVFVPCVLVPVWSDYKAIVLAERLEAREVAHLKDDIAGLERHLRALQNDPAVIARVAQRDLSFRRPNATIIPVDTVPVTAETPAIEPIAPVEPPPAVAVALEWVPFTRRAQLFADPSTRTILICLSGALLATAFALFPPRRAN